MAAGPLDVDSANDDPAQLTDRLPEGTALIEYHVARDTTIAFAAGRWGVRAVDVKLSAKVLARAVAKLLRPLERAALSDNPRAWLDAFDLTHVTFLCRHLFAPVIARCGEPPERLIVVPDGPLHAVPFELLAAATPGFREQATVSTVPSSLLLRRYRQKRAAARALILAFSPRRDTTVQGPHGPTRIGPLPRVASEARAVAKLHGESTLLLGSEACGDRLAREAHRHSLLHVAAHAWSDTQAPGLSGVVLASADADRGARLFPAERIRSLRLARTFAVVSACDSARGRVRGPEGVLGLARAFLEAGAEAVLASLWSVDDASTTRFIERFYRRLNAGDDRARALAHAKRSLRAKPSTSHPYFWAPFVLIDRNLG